MAEAIGVLASGIAVAQLASEVGSAIIKLKGLWDEVADAPERIRELIQDLQILDPLLWEIQLQFNRNNTPLHEWDDSSARLSMMYCQQALQALSDHVNDLNDAITTSKGLRRKLVAAKLVLRKDILGKLERKLQSAIRLLQMAMHCRTMALGRLSLDMLVRSLPSTNPGTSEAAGHLLCQNSDEERRIGGSSGAITAPTDEEELHDRLATATPSASRQACRYASPLQRQTTIISSSYFGTLSIKSSRNSAHLVSYQPPAWLKQAAYEVDVRRAYSGWQFHVRQYCVRTYDSTPAFSFARTGQLDRLLTLLENREASPFDRDEKGWTLLHYATESMDPVICRKLLEMGLDGCILEPYGGIYETRNPLDLTGALLNTTFGGDDKATEVMDLFRGYISNLDDFQVVESLFGLPAPSSYSRFKALQERFAPDFYSGPKCVRFAGLRRSASTPRLFTHKFYRALTKDKAVARDDIQASTQEGISIVHSVAVAFGHDSSSSHYVARPDNERWEKVLHDVLRAARPADLHHVEDVRLVLSEHYHSSYVEIPTWRSTPLFSVLQGARFRFAGHDLGQYGKTEKACFRTAGDWDESHRDIAFRMGKSLQMCVRLRDFDYGPNPDDWKLWYDVDSELFSRDFWSMVEKEEVVLRVPGSWPE